MSQQSLDVVIVTYNSLRFIRDCVNSVRENGGRAFVVDNGSSDGTLELLGREYPDVKVISNPLNGYARALNLGLQHTNGTHAVLANADVIFGKRSLSSLIEFLQNHRNVAVAGPQQVTPTGKWQRSYGREPGLAEGICDLIGITSLYYGLRRWMWPLRIDRRPKPVRYVDGAVLAVNRSAVESIGGFDEEFSFYAEETDFCIRSRKAGWKVVLVPAAVVVHYRGGSSTKLDGVSIKYWAQLVEAKATLARKASGAIWMTNLYMRLELLHSRKMITLFNILYHVAPASRRRGLDARRQMWKVEADAWRKELTRDLNSTAALSV